jgi:ABC-type molybdenum transport system ATPase subunit/photorepair protein PhrA
MERGESGLVIADEGFSSLDADNLKMVLDVFKNLPFQLLCVVHRLNDIPDNVNIINLGEQN